MTQEIDSMILTNVIIRQVSRRIIFRQLSNIQKGFASNPKNCDLSRFFRCGMKYIPNNESIIFTVFINVLCFR